ncbi:HNH endonuclease [Allosphingosinicella indica]|uniref:HNH endonuclease n=1 Tax=Allosphingosinicella indica TaxID=941907 RepID=A0A1X7FZ38_9SPHN|nr:HNH endonuclease [Allosphingosinicella indica]SMF61378.1 HNH endonuclease [Allosphingosinicella indica]
MDEDAIKQAQIAAAWEAHNAGPHGYRRQWLIRLLAMQDDKCAYCKEIISISPTGDATLDHQVPLAKAGADAFENCVAACELCNHAKGDLLPGEFALVMLDRRAQVLEGRRKRAKWRGRYSRRHP